jgi:hypothetical protein
MLNFIFTRSLHQTLKDLTANTLRLRYKADRLMLFREKSAVYGENHTKHTNTLRRQNAALIMLKQAVHIETTGLERVKHKHGHIQAPPDCPSHSPHI